MAKKKKTTDTPPEEARKASSSFSGFGLTELELVGSPQKQKEGPTPGQ